MEVQVALALLEGQAALPNPDNDYWQEKCQKLFLRPAIEPIACAYWERLRTFRFDEGTALNLASSLAGRKLVLRRGPATGRSDHGDVLFEPVETARRWLAKLDHAAKQPELALALPIYAFAQVLMAHPFSDGNGRFARLMVHAALARCAGLRRPELALAPAFYGRAETLGAAVTALSESGDWRPFSETFLSVLEDALTLSRNAPSASRGAKSNPPPPPSAAAPPARRAIRRGRSCARLRGLRRRRGWWWGGVSMRSAAISAISASR